MARCVDCCNLNLDCKKNDYTNEYLCDICTGYKAPDNQDCPLSDGFTEAYYRSDAEKERALRGISDGCFVVTATCDLLGMQPLLNPILKAFKDFKRNYLMKEPKFYRELLLYEDLGPAIAHKLLRQKDRSAKDLYKFFVDIKKDIDADKKELAYLKYKSVIMTLAEGFGFKIVKKENLEEKEKVKTIGNLQ